ncbi:heavy metal-associated isoprenylated plant protein 39-like [Spinacia oleracea]|uniref:Heavy metal-associated isoprenylated plant protein 39-like n=1 Tax=Spinacia oleracea TaxID=3562 RepID=A0A9R0IH84_SPIOL|nr:heavy metal-associated isoprenylated plant protein 39-like [Spinacia oleracea]
MAKKKTVIKVVITCQKCQTDIMKAVAKINGVEKLEVDASKGTLTIIGEVEPVPIFKKLKKIGKQPEIISVGPPRPKYCPPHCICNFCRPYYLQCSEPLPYHTVPSYSNNHCQFVAVQYPSCSYDDGPGQCTII